MTATWEILVSMMAAGVGATMPGVTVTP